MKYVSAHIVIGVLFCIFATSCTRSAGQSSSVSLSFPPSQHMSQSAGGDEAAVHIAVTVSASDFAPISQIWDGNGNANSSTTPLTMHFTVNQGSARLIQVLYVTQDSSKNLYFYYSDTTQNILSPTFDVGILMNSLTTSSVQGKIVGRYLSSAGVGPTGILNSYFSPGLGKPDMLIDRNEIFGGWFSAFSLPGMNFNYIFEDGTTLLPNYQAAASYANSPSLAYVTIPAGVRVDGSGIDSRAAQVMLAGYFGPGANSKFLCYDPSTITIPNFYTNAAMSTPIGFATGSCSANQACFVQGGIVNTSTSCTNADGSVALELDSQLLGSSDQAMLFQGPFVVSDEGSGNSQSLFGTYTGGILNLNWKFMPGATAGLDGVEIFYKWDDSTSGDSPYNANNGYACKDLVGTYGFLSGGQVAIAQTSKTINVSPPTIATQHLVAIVCPFARSRSPMYFTSGAQWNGGSSTTNGTPSYHFQLVSTGTSSNTTQTNMCTPLSLSLYDTNGNSYTPPSSLTVTLSAQANSSSLNVAGFTLDPACSTGSLQNTFSINMASSSAQIYYRTGPNDYYNLTAHSPNFADFTLDLGAAYPSSIYRLTFNSPAAMATGQCYPISVRAVGSSLMTPALSASGSSGESFGLSTTGSLSGVFYIGSSCAGSQITSATLASTDHEMFISFMPNVITNGSGTIAASSLTPAPSGGSTGNTIQAAPATQGSSTFAYNVSTNLYGNQFYPGQCFPIFVSASNSVGAPIPAPSNQSVSLSGLPNIQFFTDPNCSSSSASNLTLQSGSVSQMVYGKVNASSSSSTNGTVSGPAGTSNSMSLTLLPPSSYVISGAPANPGVGLCYPVTVVAYDPTNSPYLFPTSQSFPALLSGSLFSDSQCSAPATTYDFGAGSSASMRYAIFTSVGTQNFSINSVNVSLFGFTVSQTYLQPLASQTISGCSTSNGGTIPLSFVVNSSSVSAANIPALTASINITISSQGALLCGSSATQYGYCDDSFNYTLPANVSDTGSIINVKPPTPGSNITFTINGTGTNGIQIPPTSFTCN